MASDEASLKIANPMALALTDRRLMTLKIGAPIGMGLGGAVKELLSAVPLAEVKLEQTPPRTRARLQTDSVSSSPR